VAPTPSVMTTSVSDMETAYTDAAGRTSPDHTELGAGDVTGMTLYAGLYKWGTGLLISAGGVTISGSASDVWIFQVAQNLEVANGAIITLGGAAQAKNIYWQVGGQVTLGTTSQMKGIILCQTAIVISTGATLVGRAMAQTQVTLDANSVTAPADITAPTVTATFPLDKATSAAINKTVYATFSKSMDPTTITASTFTLMYANNKTVVPGTVTYAGLTAVFTPASNLTASTAYTATITIAAKDKAGNPMAANKVWTFTTGAYTAGGTPVPPSATTVPGFPLVVVGTFSVLGVALIARKRKKLAV